MFRLEVEEDAESGAGKYKVGVGKTIWSFFFFFSLLFDNTIWTRGWNDTVSLQYSQTFQILSYKITWEDFLEIQNN